jgi:Leucine-rich repeat (LRR) protein
MSCRCGGANIKTFDISYNSISGSIPLQLKNWTGIKVFNADRNRLNGTLPPQLSAWSSLTFIIVRGNQLNGTLPLEFGLWSRALTYFRADHNQLTGTLPPEYANWSRTDAFCASGNRISGTLPPEYAAWELITALEISGNTLNGTLPESYCALTNLRSFSVANNLLNGTLPGCFGKWTSLVQFSVNGNQFTGTLPSNLSACSKLREFDVSDNFLSGSLPSEYAASWGILSTFDVRNNSLSGTIPRAYFTWSSPMLYFFLARQNLLDGTLPDFFPAWGSTISQFDVENNFLSGSIPRSWAVRMKNLTTLTVANNSMSGSIPLLPSLSILSISMNRFSGTLPAALSALSVLDAQNNTELSGAFKATVATTCGTQLCIAVRDASLQACFPPTRLQLGSLSVSDMALLAIVYKTSVPSCAAPTAPPPPANVSGGNSTRSHRTTTAPLSAPTTTVMVYTAIVAGGTSGAAVPGIQRAASLLRIAGQCCTAGALESSDASLPVDPLLSDVADNPLHAHIPVGSDLLEYAAGAAVVNFLLVCGIGVVLHALVIVQRRVSRSSVFTVLVEMMPSSLLPGALAATYGVLVQPALMACVALLVSSERTSGSIACGVVMLCTWMIFPVYCTVEVLWRARRHGSFLLTTTTIAPLSLKARGHRTWLVRAAALRRYVFRPHQKWGERNSPSKTNSRRNKEQSKALLTNMELVFGGYVRQREWFFAIEWLLSIVSGAVLGAAQAASADAGTAESCNSVVEWAGGSAIAFTVAHMLLCVALRPNSVRAELWASVLLDAMSVVSVALSMRAQDTAADDVTGAAAIVQTAVAVLFMANGLHGRWERAWLETAAHLKPIQTLRQTVVAVDDNCAAIIQSRPKVAAINASVKKACNSNICFVESTMAPRDGQLRELVELICSRKKLK